MKNILELIIENKRLEVATKKELVPIPLLEKMKYFQRAPIQLSHSFSKNEPNIIAEYKRKSPSKGIINNIATVDEVSNAYAAGGAAAISILTDGLFFGGSLEDLLRARKHPIPLLRKDFIIDPYQIFESKAYGADLILLIAACLSKEEIALLSSLAKSLGMNVLLEIHAKEELNFDLKNVDAVGVNNRDLKTFKVNIEHSIELATQIPEGVWKIAESGISNHKIAQTLMQFGFDGFLIGELFMKHASPGKVFADFINDLKMEKSPAL